MIPGAAIIFGAGFGTRMGALTATRPKPLIPLAGRTLLDRTIDLARGAGIERIVVNAHYLADQIEAHLSDTGIAVSVEHPAILDTGGGLKAALPLLPAARIFTANPDAVWAGPNPFHAVAEAAQDDADATLLLVPRDRAEARDAPGDFTLHPDGSLSRGGPMVYTGIQIIRTDCVGRVPEPVFSLNRVWDDLIAEGRLRGVPYAGRWCDVGTPEGLERAARLVREDA